MFTDTGIAVGTAAKNKVQFLRENPPGYFAASLLAGFYVGPGILLIFTIGGQLSGALYTKLIMGISFGIALSLVVMAGSELFTGNVLVMSFACLKKEVSLADTLSVWGVSYIGNWLGSILLWCLFVFITTGFEHSIANMTLLTSALLTPFDTVVSLSGYFYNILIVTLGNIAGALFILALPYCLITKAKKQGA
ncbi:MAG: formate/nitrite transporter family protein [Lachnospiraceae bacterium]